MNINKVILVSFFQSNNLGDTVLSESIENMVIKKKYKVIKYDFLTINKINTVNKKVIVGNKKSIIEKNFLKKILYNLIGEFYSNKIIYKIKKKLFYRNNWKKIKLDLEESEMLIIGGGNMIMDLSSTWPALFNDYIDLAKKLNKKIRVVFVGVGPLKFSQNFKIIETSLSNIEFISVRDSKSKEILENISSDLLIEETVDPAFSLEFISLKERLKINKDSLDNKEFIIGVCVLSEVCFNGEEEFDKYKKGLINLIIKLFELNNNVHFILFSTEKMDYSVVEELYSILNKYSNIVVEKYDINVLEDLKKLYLKINFLIGGRMHSLIFGQKFLLPKVGFVWQDKLISFSKITASENQMYTINDLYQSYDEIAKDILKIQKDIKIIDKMNMKNKELEELVNKGLDLS